MPLIFIAFEYFQQSIERNCGHDYAHLDRNKTECSHDIQAFEKVSYSYVFNP